MNQFPIRGFHLDLKIQVMTLNALKSLAAELAEMGINTLIMEWEASYPFKSTRSSPTVIHTPRRK
jgi:hypothetical protein